MGDLQCGSRRQNVTERIGARISVECGIGRGTATDRIENYNQSARHQRKYRVSVKLSEMNAPTSRLIEAARAAHRNAYGRYSGFAVGAAIRLSDGAIYAGCNVENASYGATICAERNAICAGIAASGARPIAEIVVVSDGAEPWPPCGMCRQFISEFAAPDCIVYALGRGETVRSWRFDELMPAAFGAADMNI